MIRRIRAWLADFLGHGGCWWLLGGGLLGLLVLALFLVGLPLLSEPAASSGPSPILTVVVYPTTTPTPSATATAEPIAESTPTATSPPSQGGFQLGQLVQIQGTEGDGLRLREAASLEGAIRFVALESEVFEVTDGPIEQDGYIWWFLTNPYDNSKQGWGVSNFMRSAES